MEGFSYEEWFTVDESQCVESALCEGSVGAPLSLQETHSAAQLASDVQVQMQALESEGEQLRWATSLLCAYVQVRRETKRRDEKRERE